MARTGVSDEEVPGTATNACSAAEPKIRSVKITEEHLRTMGDWLGHALNRMVEYPTRLDDIDEASVKKWYLETWGLENGRHVSPGSYWGHADELLEYQRRHGTRLYDNVDLAELERCAKLRFARHLIQPVTVNGMRLIRAIHTIPPQHILGEMRGTLRFVEDKRQWGLGCVSLPNGLAWVPDKNAPLTCVLTQQDHGDESNAVLAWIPCADRLDPTWSSFTMVLVSATTIPLLSVICT
jgi:hypothetical protein